MHIKSINAQKLNRSRPDRIGRKEQPHQQRRADRIQMAVAKPVIASINLLANISHADAVHMGLYVLILYVPWHINDIIIK